MQNKDARDKAQNGTQNFSDELNDGIPADGASIAQLVGLAIVVVGFRFVVR